MFKAGVELEMSYGYTTADEGRATASQVAVMQAYAAANKLPIDIVAYPDVMNDAADALKHSPTYVNRFRIGGGKLTIDGSPQGKTAWRDRPYYVVPPGERLDYVGYAAVTNDQAMDAIDDAFKNNYQILTHANGEAAIDLFIAGIREATAKYGNLDRRPVLVHGQFIREDQVDALKELQDPPLLLPDAHLLLGRLAPRADRRPGAGRQHLADRLGGAARHDLQLPLRRAGRLPGFDAHPVGHRHPPLALGRHHRPGPARRRHDRAEGDDHLAGLPALRGGREGQHRDRQARRFRRALGDPIAIDPETLDGLKVMATIKEGVTVYTRPTDPAAVKKASLQYRPGATTDPFANMLHRAALMRDATRSGRLNPFAMPAIRAAALAPHNSACAYDVLFRAMGPVDAALAGRALARLAVTPPPAPQGSGGPPAARAAGRRRR